MTPLAVSLSSVPCIVAGAGWEYTHVACIWPNSCAQICGGSGCRRACCWNLVPPFNMLIGASYRMSAQNLCPIETWWWISERRIWAVSPKMSFRSWRKIIAPTAQFRTGFCSYILIPARGTVKRGVGICLHTMAEKAILSFVLAKFFWPGNWWNPQSQGTLSWLLCYGSNMNFLV